jgi:hypothetical protein
MTGSQRFLTRMVLFLIVVAIGAGALYPRLQEAFLANAVLNGMILGVLLIGIVYIFRTVLLLNREVRWIESFRKDESSLTSDAQPRLLAPMATMLGERGRSGGRISLSTLSMRSILDSIAARLEESREISRYMIGLLIFLGLLGTFWGLLETVSSVAGVIANLTVASGETEAIFRALTTGLQTPLSGMGTAFSSSLFGLAGSLVLGFLELQATQSHNRFFNDLEEWLSSLTRLSSGSLGGEGDQAVPAYIQALLEQTADSLEDLQRTLARGEESRIAVNNNIMALTEKLATLTEQQRSENQLLTKLAESQGQVQHLLGRMGDSNGFGGMDEATRNHIRNLEVYLARMLEEMSTGRQQTTQEIRNEIRLLARTIAAIAEEGEA